MSVRRFAVVAASAVALTLPVLTATSATAAPTAAAPAAAPSAAPMTSCHVNPYLPWAVHGTSAVKIRSKATTKSTAVGVLYKSQKFKVHSHTPNWVYITNKSTGVKGYVSATYVYRDVRMCLS
ncbi:SH3 domain-containing protein [Streptomyces anulatus]